MQPKAVRRFCGSSRATKSLVARRSGKKGQFSEVSKGVIQNDICEFESSRPRQPVWSQTGLARGRTSRPARHGSGHRGEGDVIWHARNAHASPRASRSSAKAVALAVSPAIIRAVLAVGRSSFEGLTSSNHFVRPLFHLPFRRCVRLLQAARERDGRPGARAPRRS